MNQSIPKKIMLAGAALIAVSGLVSLVIGVISGSMLYEPDPNKVFGHIGIIAGMTALIISGLIFLITRVKYDSSVKLLLAGLGSIVLGHAGAIAGALMIGTAGVLCCYTSGVWLIVLAFRHWIAGKRSR